MRAICARLRLISHIIRCPGYIQSVPAGENYLGSFGEISPQMLPCIPGKRHRAALAHGWRCGDGHRRVPPARDTGCHVLWGAEDLQLVGVKSEELLALPREKTWLCWVRAGERAGFVVVPALFHVKNERVKSVSWKFLREAKGGGCPQLLQTKIGRALGFL